VLGVGTAGLLIIANFLSLPYYPVWSISAIAMYGFIVWALCVVRPDARPSLIRGAAASP
jgi:nitrate reductase NapE component